MQKTLNLNIRLLRNFEGTSTFREDINFTPHQILGSSNQEVQGAYREYGQLKVRTQFLLENLMGKDDSGDLHIDKCVAHILVVMQRPQNKQQDNCRC